MKNLDINADLLFSGTARSYAMVTLLLGALYVVYHALWIGRPDPPFTTPGWLVTGQLVWGLISFGMIFLYERQDRSPVLPALYVIYTAATYSYVWYLGTTRGSVTDAMVPLWWKLGAMVAGVIYVVEGARQSRLDSDRS